jgi:hypothetical protein
MHDQEYTMTQWIKPSRLKIPQKKYPQITWITQINRQPTE